MKAQARVKAQNLIAMMVFALIIHESEIGLGWKLRIFLWWWSLGSSAMSQKLVWGESSESFCNDGLWVHHPWARNWFEWKLRTSSLPEQFQELSLILVIDGVLLDSHKSSLTWLMIDSLTKGLSSPPSSISKKHTLETFACQIAHIAYRTSCKLIRRIRPNWRRLRPTARAPRPRHATPGGFRSAVRLPGGVRRWRG